MQGTLFEGEDSRASTLTRIEERRAKLSQPLLSQRSIIALRGLIAIGDEATQDGIEDGHLFVIKPGDIAQRRDFIQSP